jgi:hypothetical protein
VPPEVREMVAHALRGLAKEATNLANEFDPVTEVQETAQVTARVPRLKRRREPFPYQPRLKSSEVHLDPGDA